MRVSQAPYSDIEIPRLFLALQGFTAAQQALIAGWLADDAVAHTAGQVSWVLMDERHADVVIHARPLSKPAHSQRDEKQGVLSQVHRTFWEDAEQEQQETEADSHQRFLMLLVELTEHLQLHCASFALAGELIDRYLQGSRRKGVWHVQANGALLAVVNYDQLSFAVRPQTRALALAHCAWEQRSTQAVAPQGFMVLGLEAALWDYTRRTERNLLPKRYEREVISLRRFPRQALASMYAEEVAVLASLRAQPQSMQALEHGLGMSNSVVRKTLATLYFAGAISSKPQSVWSRLQQRLQPDAGPLFRNTQMFTQSDPEWQSERAGPASIVLKAPADKKTRSLPRVRNYAFTRPK